ncbi:rab effector MyRIP-like isoform X2 [Carcharodon carcharias]|uniref:rab effector MyRIP-like isoform X2 n=1 Tax=Carcharodon carcharias TaxID=13397 RepID=UPI001B7EB290|nr:rab effector MyRIP-like isoform X2 [Carcharodon carcharias]
MARKLDLSKLTEDEAEHVLHVVQRDLNLRKKEEERLGELRSQIEEETTKRTFLTKQAKFNEGHCIHCLEPFQFLVNSKRRCLDCCLYTCKSCSKFNKKEDGWVCDSCRISRIVNTGSLDWYYNHVRSRFKNFGSAKVMHSLHKRLQPAEKRPLRLDSHYERDGFDNISDSYLHGEYNPQMITGVIEEDEAILDNSEAHRYSLRRHKRLLSVHPIDFDLDSEYSAQSRRQSLQLPSPQYDGSGLQSFSEFSFTGNGVAQESSRRGSVIGEADMTSVFRKILHEKGQNLMPESEFSTEVRLEINKRRKSLDKSSKSDEVVHRERRLPRTRSVPGIWTSPGEAELHHSLPYQKHGAPYYADMESSDNDEAPEHPVYQRHFVRHRSKSSSQENSGSGGSQLSDLSKRMSSIERMLCRLEEKMTPSSVKSPANTGRLPLSPPVDSEASGLDLTDADIEEEKLKKKLGELASNISDKGPSSDDEEVKRKIEGPREMTSSSEDLHNEAVKCSSAVALCDITTKALRIINATEKALYDFAEVDGTVNEPLTNSSFHLKSSEKDLSVSEADEAYRKLEENVYMAASTNYGLERQLKDLEERARSRQSHTTTTTDSELSELEDKVASAVAKVQYTESEVSDIENRIAALSAAGMNVSTEDKPKRKQDGQAMMVQQCPRRKSSNPTGNKESKTDRNLQSKGSLTQRNPSNKSRRLDRVFGKPVMSMRP